MKVSCANFDRTGDIMIIPVFKDFDKAPNNTTVGLGRGPSIAVKAAAASDAISGKVGESLSVWTKGCTVIFIGVGRKGKLTHKVARDTGAKCLASLSKDLGNDIVIRFTSGWSTENMTAFAEGMMLRDYQFDKYQKKDEENNHDGWTLECQSHDRHLEALSESIEKASLVNTGVHLSRDLANEPANRLYPEEFGRRALEWAEGKDNVEVEVWDYARLQKEGMHGVIAVGKGSIRKPYRVCESYLFRQRLHHAFLPSVVVHNPILQPPHYPCHQPIRGLCDRTLQGIIGLLAHLLGPDLSEHR